VRCRVGELEVHVLRTGRFRLDGGAMFGVVPRPIWEKLCPPDERNRIELGLNCLHVRAADGRSVVVDTGIGRKWDAKSREIYAIEDDPGIVLALERDAGVRADEVDLVVNTHLHFDHAGGNTVALEPGGSLAPTFPRARYVVQRGNLEEEALAPNELRRASYLPENFMPLVERGLMDLVEGDREVAPGISVLVTGGHQRYHQAVIVASRGERAIFLGDLVPTAAHVQPPYIMGYDHYPLETLAKKKELLERAALDGWLVIFEHEPRLPAGRLARDGKRFRFEPLEGDSR